MARERVLIPGGQKAKLKPYLDGQALVVSKIVTHVLLTTGRTIPDLEKMKTRVYTVVKYDKDIVEGAMNHIPALTYVLHDMATRTTKDTNEMYLADFTTLVQTMDAILLAVATGESYELAEDVEQLLNEVEIAIHAHAIKRHNPETILQHAIHTQDAATTHTMAKGRIPMEFIKYIKDKKIEMNKDNRDITREYAAKFNAVKVYSHKERMDQQDKIYREWVSRIK